MCKPGLKLKYLFLLLYLLYLFNVICIYVFVLFILKSCENIINQTQCISLSTQLLINKKCVWEENECHELKTSCESITNPDSCEVSGVAKSGDIILSCKLIENKCYEMRTSCESITNMSLCELSGIARSGDTILSCKWIEGNSSIPENGSCELEVI
jgi:hypothetical protein